MKLEILEKIDKEQMKTDITDFNVGDTIKVFFKIKEGDKERIQTFSGVVLARRGHGISETFVVRRISHGEGVERVFPLHSPFIDKIEREKAGRVRRAKLYYLRERQGKKFKVKEARMS